MTGGAEAQYNSLGGTINLIATAGSNEWKINASQYVNHEALSAGQQFGTQVYQGGRPFLRLAPASASGLPEHNRGWGSDHQESAVGERVV